jgi:hypothetical protein
MSAKVIRIGLTACVLVLAFGGLLWSTLRDGTEYYKHVDEVMTRPDAWYRFQVQSKDKIVSAAYTGIVPDTFKDDAEVVLKGTLSPSGFEVEPNGVMAKCPSKYEAKPGSVASAKPPGA